MPLTKQQRADTLKAQVAQFENEKFGHESNIMRLMALPESDHDESWAAALQSAFDAIDTLEGTIASTKAAADVAIAGNAIVDLKAARKALKERQEQLEAEAEAEAAADEAAEVPAADE